MRASPLVCVEADEMMSPHKRVSVIVFGRYEELPDTPESQLEREFAWKSLRQYPFVVGARLRKTILHGTERVPEPIFYPIYIARITDRRATLEPAAPVAVLKVLPKRR